jgi:hypothetical protein
MAEIGNILRFTDVDQLKYRRPRTRGVMTGALPTPGLTDAQGHGKYVLEAELRQGKLRGLALAMLGRTLPLACD